MGIVIRAWRRLPTIVHAVIAGSLVVSLGTLPWAALAAANLRLWPAVPWSVVVMAAYLWLYWRFLGGQWWPRSTAESRRESLRARRIGSRAWRAALLAGGLGWGGLVALRIAYDELLGLPRGALPDTSALPVVTVAAYWLTLSVVAGVAEEAGFRGYMQVPIERRHGPVAAILVAGTAFWLAHGWHYAGSGWTFLLHAWFYLAASALYGIVAYWTASILPCIVLHAAGDVLGVVMTAWLASPADGVDRRAPLLRSACAAAIVLVPAALWAGCKLARSARGWSRASPGPSGPP
jgi:membrane protease YdiL (CAAX protease family)